MHLALAPTRAPVARRIEQRFPNSKPGVTKRGFMFRLERLCWFLRTRFVRNLPTDGNQSFDKKGWNLIDPPTFYLVHFSEAGHPGDVYDQEADLARDNPMLNQPDAVL